MYLCWGYQDYASFCNFSIGLWNGVVFVVFYFLYLFVSGLCQFLQILQTSRKSLRCLRWSLQCHHVTLITSSTNQRKFYKTPFSKQYFIKKIIYCYSFLNVFFFKFNTHWKYQTFIQYLFFCTDFIHIFVFVFFLIHCYTIRTLLNVTDQLFCFVSVCVIYIFFCGIMFCTITFILYLLHQIFLKLYMVQ